VSSVSVRTPRLKARSSLMRSKLMIVSPFWRLG
jgi:hypothetical protein